MKRFLLALIITFLLVNQLAYSQACSTTGGCSNFGSQHPSGTASSTSSSWTTVGNDLYAGNWSKYNVVTGSTYEWTTCNLYGGTQGYDAQLTLVRDDNQSLLCYNDDSNISSCPNSPYISYTATFTGVVRILLSKYSCTTSGTISSTLVWRRASAPTCNSVSIATHPQNTTVNSGSTATFSVSANGTSPFQYQWYKNNSQVSGATSSSYTTPTLSITDNGNYYYCIVYNCSNLYSQTSNSATLTVNAPCTGISIASHPQNQQANPGNTAAFTINVSGTAPFQYIWYKLGNALQTTTSNATQGTYTTPSLSLSDNGSSYYCIVSNCSNTSVQTSNSATLTVTNPTCVTWLDGTPSDPTVVAAAEFLCQRGIIPSQQRSSELESLYYGQAAAFVVDALYNGATPSVLPSDNYPCLVTDISILSNDEMQSTKALLYLEHNDGKPCIDRDFFSINPARIVVRIAGYGNIIRMILEGWKIAPDNTGADVYSHTPSSFLSNVYKDDANYGYFQKANQLGLLNSFISSGTFTETKIRRFLYIFLHKMFLSYGNAIPLPADYYVPNNFSPNNSSQSNSISKAVFETNEQSGFNIPSGGLDLNFDFSYHSDLIEYPSISQDLTDYPDGKGNLYLQLAMLRNHPLGKGWTHTYNTYANILKGVYNNINVDKYLLIRWGDGSTTFYNIPEHKFETGGVYDDLIIDSTHPSDGILIFRIITKNKITYLFRRSPNNSNHFYCAEISDRNINKLILDYDYANCNYGNGSCLATSSYRLTTVKELTVAYTRKLLFTYKPNSDLLAEVSDDIGRKIIFSTNSLTLNLDSYTNPKGGITNYTYCTQDSCKNLLVSITRPKGNTITNTYSKRKLKQTATGTYTAKVAFNTSYSNSNISTSSNVSVTPTNGQTQTYTTTFQNNANGEVTNVSSQNTNVSFTYGDLNNPTLPTSVLDNKTGITEAFTYDTRGNQTFHSKSASGVTTISETLTYNTNNDLLTYQDPNGGTTTYAYDANGNLVTKTDPMAGVTQMAVDSRGLITLATNPSGLKTYFGYNTYGNLNSIRKDLTPTASIITQAVYDDVSRVISIIDPKGTQTSYQYDNNDNITQETEDPTGLNIATNYTFDANDNATVIQNANGNATTLTYDNSTDDLIQESFGGKNKFWTYNDDGSLKTYTNKAGTSFNYQYYTTTDQKEGLLKSDGINQYDYDLNTKKLKTVTKGANTLNYTYDGFQRVSRVDYNDFSNNAVQYQYNNNGNISRITYNSAGTYYFNYEYDANNRVKKITDWLNRTIVFYNYLADGRLAGEYKGSNTTYHNYDAVGRENSLGLFRTTQNSTIAIFDLKLDSLGFIREENRREAINVGYPYLLALANNYTTDAANRYTQIDGTSITYDGNNNQSIFGGATYTFDSQSQLTSANSSALNLSFEYDPLGNRRKKNNTRYVVDVLNNANLLMETDLSGTPKVLYIHGNGLVCRYDISTEQYSFYHFDMRGSTVAITNFSGTNVTHTYAYGPFGESLQKVEDFKQPFQYVGKYGVMTDSTNLYFMRARYYNPLEGRFLSEDPVWATNLYPYADNNPINKIDPDGRVAQWILGASIGAVSNALAYALFEPADKLTKAGLLRSFVEGGIVGGLYVVNPTLGFSYSVGFDANENMRENNMSFNDAMASSIFSNVLTLGLSTVVSASTTKVLGKAIIKNNPIIKNFTKNISKEVTETLSDFAKDLIEDRVNNKIMNSTNNTLKKEKKKRKK